MSEAKQLTAISNTQAAKIEQVVIHNDLSKLTDAERVLYYKQVCDHMGIDWTTQPFSYLQLNGKLTLYANKSCTDQLRSRRGVSVKITAREKIGDVYVVTAQAKDATGREDESTGAVAITQGLKGDALANAYMKCETKAKRRVTLSLCGLGFLDESEADSIAGAHKVDVNLETGEIKNVTPPKQDTAPPVVTPKAAPVVVESKPLADPGEYIVQVGKKFKGQPLKLIHPEELESFIEWIEKDASPRFRDDPQTVEFMERALVYLRSINWVAPSQDAQEFEDAPF